MATTFLPSMYKRALIRKQTYIFFFLFFFGNTSLSLSPSLPLSLSLLYQVSTKEKKSSFSSLSLVYRQYLLLFQIPSFKVSNLFLGIFCMRIFLQNCLKFFKKFKISPGFILKMLIPMGSRNFYAAFWILSLFLVLLLNSFNLGTYKQMC